MADLVPWWVWLILLARQLLVIGFVLLAGVVQGRSTGQYPTLKEWCAALHLLRRPPGMPRRRERLPATREN
ncbi:hypothetical protein [Frankia sp. EAN1pec]|uniref:hypothetical protein n=1 Tax=Parafrankia sp. (strain EAN1pec) TaxID=298653 RepID=UPI00059EA29E